MMLSIVRGRVAFKVAWCMHGRTHAAPMDWGRFWDREVGLVAWTPSRAAEAKGKTPSASVKGAAKLDLI